MKEIDKKISNKIIFGKYKIIKNIGKGAYSKVFLTKNIINQDLFALKIQNKSHKFGSLESEAFYLFRLKYIGVPKIFSYGHLGQYYILVEELLGKTLEELFKENKNKPNIIRLKDMLMAGIQIINIIKYIHSKNILHLDIKPHNFLVGNPNNSIIYIIDFGLAKNYRSSRTGKHSQFSKNNYFNGNICFSSVNTMKGYEPSRRDDLESIGYMLIYLYTQHLPWDSILTKNKNELIKKIFEIKSLIPIKMLCENTPKEMNEYMKYVKSLKFEEEPDYNYLIKIFEDMLKKINQVNDLNFSWINEELKNNSSKINLLNNKIRRSSPFTRIIKDIESKSAYEDTINKNSTYNNSQLISQNEENILYKKENNKIVKQFEIIKKIPESEQYSERKNNNTVNNKKKIKILKTAFNNKSKNLFKNINVNVDNIIYKKRINQLNKGDTKNKTTKIIKNNKSNKKSIVTRNKNLSNEFIITPIISNKIINIYSNNKKYSFNDSNNNSYNNSKIMFFKNKTLVHNNTNNEFTPLKNKYLLNKYNQEYESWKNNINNLKNSFLYSFLSPDIIYNRKFNK